MDEQELNHKRKVAKERITNQFGHVLQSTGMLLVDCGPVGKCVVTKNADYEWFDVTWLQPTQDVTLAGKLD